MGKKFVAPERISGDYIGEEEKAELIAQGAELVVTAVSLGPDSFNAGKFRYTLKVQLDGEERLLAFAAGSDKPYGRDILFDALIEHFQDEDAETVSVVMEKVKGTRYIDVVVVDEAE